MIYHVYANRSNIGDWLSALGIQSLLRPHPVTELLCDEPFVPETLDTLAHASSQDLVVIGGGGLFMDYFTPFWEGLLHRAAHVPYCIWGVGFCDLKREPSRLPERLLEEVVRRSQLCVVRDRLTRHALGGELLPPVACPSLAMVEPPTGQGHGLLHVDNYSTAGADVYEAMDAAGREFAERTGRPCRGTNNRISGGDVGALTNTLLLYERSDLVLSSALHGCIIAVAMGRPVLAVSGDRKIESFMEAVGLRDWVCDITETASIPARLETLGRQPSVLAFREAAVAANAEVARHVQSRAGLASMTQAPA